MKVFLAGVKGKVADPDLVQQRRYADRGARRRLVSFEPIRPALVLIKLKQGYRAKGR